MLQLLTVVANLSVFIDSLTFFLFGLMLINMSVFEFPPSESRNKNVNFEFLYGMCWDWNKKNNFENYNNINYLRVNYFISKFATDQNLYFNLHSQKRFY